MDKIYPVTFLGVKFLIGLLYIGRENLFRHYLRFRFLFQHIIVDFTLLSVAMQDEMAISTAFIALILIILEEAVLLLFTYKYLIFDEEDPLLLRLMKVYKIKRKLVSKTANTDKVASRIYDNLKFTDILNPSSAQNFKSQANKEELGRNFKIIHKPKYANLRKENKNSRRINALNGFTAERNFSTMNLNKDLQYGTSFDQSKSNEASFMQETQKRLKLT
mmetsp:Transcript_27126/g.23992  ORF Transcript_27126/g.23992 Transcript_27126/m.23992 type:complete len:219 (+) Transcript_27126:134-790(+)